MATQYVSIGGHGLSGCAGQIPHVSVDETRFVCHNTFILDENGNVTIAGTVKASKVYLNDSGADYLGWSSGDSCFKVTSGFDVSGTLFANDISGGNWTGATIDATDYIETPVLRNTDGDTVTIQDKLDVIGIITAPNGNSTNWNTAYGWGDHALGGYSTFGGSEGEIAYGNAFGELEGVDKLFWDSSNKRMGLGINTPERTLHIQDDNGVVRIDRDTNSPAFILARFPNNDYTTPWKTFIVGVDATGPDAGTFHISDMHQNVSGSNDRRITIESDGTVDIPGNITVGGTTGALGNVEVTGRLEVTGNMKPFHFGNVSEDKISLYEDRLGGTGMYGFGVESNSLYYKSPMYHCWYINANADGGVSSKMNLTSLGLGLGTPTPHDNFHIVDTSPSIILEESDANNSEKVWELTATGGMLKLLAQSDLYSATQTVFEIDRGGTSPTTFCFPNSKVGIRTSALSGQLTVDQPSTSGAIPVLTLDQGDVDEPFIEFLGGTVYGGMSGTNKYLKVKADNGGTYYLRLFN